MDIGERSPDGPDGHGDGQGFEDLEQADEAQVERPRELPADLPRSLDDRKNFRSYNEETEYYDAWQGG